MRDERAAQYRALVKQFPNGVIVLFDDELRYRLVGPEELPFSRRKAADMEGKTIVELFGEEAAARLEPHYRATLAGEERSFDVPYEGRVHHLETRPVQIEGQSPMGLVITQDVTDERRREAEITRQKARLEEFASIVSHDLRNPLSVAMGYLEAEQRTNDSTNVAQAMTALERMNRIVDELLTAAQKGEPATDSEPVSLERVARAAWTMVDAGDATLVVDADAELLADESRLQRIFENLFRNAREHAGDDVTVTVGPTAGGFYVEDDGPGIPENEREQVWQTGYSTATDGTGFGLFIVRDLAEAHEWSVSLVESETGGVRFEFQGVEFAGVADSTDA